MLASMGIEEVEDELRARPLRWLVTGAAGFIGSHVVERLLLLDQEVVGFDNLSTGSMKNLDEVRRHVSPERAQRLHFVKADLRDRHACHGACARVDLVLHVAGLTSPQRSLAEPVAFHQANVDGIVHMLAAARETGVRRFVYASDAAIGADVLDTPFLATKAAGEIYARAFQQAYGLECVGLRLSEVYGPRDATGAIARWTAALVAGQAPEVASTEAREPCNVDDAVQALLLAATAPAESTGGVWDVSSGERLAAAELLARLQARIAAARPELSGVEPREVAPGVVAPPADLAATAAALAFAPTVHLDDGLDAFVAWVLGRLPRAAG